MISISTMPYRVGPTYNPLFEKAFLCGDIYDNVFSMISPRTSIMLSRTCTIASDSRASFNRRAFSINRELGRYFGNPLQFRNLQAQTGTLISGSFALQFFERTVYEDSDLDLYLHPGHLYQVGSWLIDNEGYIYVKEESPGSQLLLQSFDEFHEACDNLDLRHVSPAVMLSPLLHRPLHGPTSGDPSSYSRPEVIRATLTFIKNIGQPTQRVVQLVVAYYTPMDVILQFHSSK